MSNFGTAFDISQNSHWIRAVVFQFQRTYQLMELISIGCVWFQNTHRLYKLLMKMKQSTYSFKNIIRNALLANILCLQNGLFWTCFILMMMKYRNIFIIMIILYLPMTFYHRGILHVYVYPYGHRPHNIGKQINLFWGIFKICNDKNVGRRICYDTELIDYLVFIFIAPNQIVLKDVSWINPNSLDLHSKISFNIYKVQIINEKYI